MDIPQGAIEVPNLFICAGLIAAGIAYDRRTAADTASSGERRSERIRYLSLS